MTEGIWDQSDEILLAGDGPCAEAAARALDERAARYDRVATDELERVAPAPDGKWWVSLKDGGSRLYGGLVLSSAGQSGLAEEVVPRGKEGPELVGGLVPPGYKNIYFFGIEQGQSVPERYVSRGARLLCEMIETQPVLEHPIGALLQRMGVAVRADWWGQPLLAAKDARLARWVLPRLPDLEKTVMGGDPKTARLRALAGLLRERIRSAD